MAAPSPSPPPNLLPPPLFRPEKAYFFLRTCSNFPQLKQIHAKIIRHNLANDQLLARHLITLSSSFGETRYASLVFRQLHSPSTFTWNLMIRSLSVNNKPREALLLFVLMLSHSNLDKFTFPFVIKACLASSSLRLGTQVHGLALKTGFFTDVFLQNTLMDLYFKCGRPVCGRKVFDEMPGRNIVSWTTVLNGLVSNERLDDAEIVFRQMPARNVVSWTAMITAYVKNRRPDEAFQLFRRMQVVDNVKPNEFTLVSMLQASTQLGSLSMGRWVHDYAHKNGFSLDCFLGTALIDMYSKCGSLEDARRVFDVMESKSLATWNSMITSLGVHGLGEEALSLFEEMEDEEGVEPDAITFVGLLSACANTRNVKDGLRYFLRMIHVYNITPIEEHSACMIQLLEQALEAEKVSNYVDSLDYDPNLNTSFEVESTERVNDRLESWSQHHISFSKWDAD